MKIFSVLNWIGRLLKNFLGGDIKAHSEKRSQLIKKTANSENIQVTGDEITAKGEVVKTGDGSSVIRGGSGPIYNNCIFFFPPDQFQEAKYKAKQVIEKEILKKFPDLEEEKIESATRMINETSTPCALSTAIATVSGSLSAGSHEHVSSIDILNEFYDNLSEYVVDYSNTWTCSECNNVNVSNLCIKCGKKKP